jgi:glucose/arabinose dehydrogenase
LKHPRWIHALPNGDVLVAEATQVPGPVSSVFGYAMQSTMRRAAALGVSANRITLLRDADGDGITETREVFLEGLNQPFGMALLGDTFYVGNTDGVVAFPYTEGASRITAPGRKLTAFKPGGHWTRSLLPSPDGRKLFVGVGSLSNIAESGMAAEEGRAAIYELDLAGGGSRIFAIGGRRWTTGCRRIRPRSPRPSHRTMRWAGTPRRWACAGCRPARCPAFRKAWRSGNTAPGIAAR